MNTSVSGIFEIKPSPSGDNSWLVTWPGYGPVKKTNNRVLMMYYAFESGAETIGIVIDNKKVNEDLLWVDSTLYYSSKNCLDFLILELSQEGQMVGLIFPLESSAEKFVDAVEKHIILKLLAKDYHV